MNLKKIFNLFSTPIDSLDELGVFGIAHEESGDKTFCYYLLRSFGNIIIHKTPNLSEFYNSFKNRGGIYKQLDFKPHFTTMNTEIFNIFGAALVTEEEFFDKKYPTEILNKDFRDAHIKTLTVKGHTSLLIYLREKWLLFLHPNINDTDFFPLGEFEQLQESKVEYVFFHEIKKIQRCYLSLHEFKELVK